MTNEEAKVFLDNLKICIDEYPIVADWLVEIADHKTENSSEKPNNCTNCECTDDCSECKFAEHGCKDEPQTESSPKVPLKFPKSSQDEPQTERSE